MPWANATSASLCAFASGAAAELDTDIDVVTDEPSLLVAPPEQALSTRVDAASAAIPYPYRLCCIAHPSSTDLSPQATTRHDPPLLQPRSPEYGSPRHPMKI